MRDDWLDADMELLERWNTEVAGPLRSMFEDALLGIASRGLIGNGHTRTLLQAMLSEFHDIPPDVSGGISEDAASVLEALVADYSER